MKKRAKIALAGTALSENVVGEARRSFESAQADCLLSLVAAGPVARKTVSRGNVVTLPASSPISEKMGKLK
jgi:hypothetical protein